MAKFRGYVESDRRGGSTASRLSSRSITVVAQSFDGDCKVHLHEVDGVTRCQVMLCEHGTHNGRIIYNGPVCSTV